MPFAQEMLIPIGAIVGVVCSIPLAIAINNQSMSHGLVAVIVSFVVMASTLIAVRQIMAGTSSMAVVFYGVTASVFFMLATILALMLIRRKR